jgi:hypothetical protein
MLPADFDGLALSPVTPLGTCAAVGAADRNRVLSTVRSSEIVSDPTNVLALEAAARRRGGADAVHLAACHRALRNQQFDAPDAAAHFELFADGDAAEIELGDGGFTGWTAALMADAKERCLISCISTERLTQLIDRDG